MIDRLNLVPPPPLNTSRSVSENVTFLAYTGGGGGLNFLYLVLTSLCFFYCKILSNIIFNFLPVPATSSGNSASHPLFSRPFTFFWWLLCTENLTDCTLSRPFWLKGAISWFVHSQSVLIFVNYDFEAFFSLKVILHFTKMT